MQEGFKVGMVLTFESSFIFTILTADVARNFSTPDW